MITRALQTLLLFTTSVLALSWLAVIVVDGLNVMNLGNRIIERSGRDASLFVKLFGENRPVEWAQWICLASACIISAYISAVESLRRNHGEHKFFLLFSVLFALMLIEDAGNIRHGIGEVWLSTEQFTGLVKYITFAFYFLISLIPVWAIIRYGRSFMSNTPMYWVFGTAFIFYFSASFFSASAFFIEWYHDAGEFINQVLFDGRVIYGYDWHPSVGGHWIMDYLIEESLELIGAILFLLFNYLYFISLFPTNKPVNGITTPV